MNQKAWWFSIVRVFLIAAVLWGLLLALGGVLRIAPGWPPSAVACGIALAAELLLLLYRYESRNLGSRRSRQLIALRLAALALLAWILIEPTFVRKVKRELDRQVAQRQPRLDMFVDVRGALCDVHGPRAGSTAVRNARDGDEVPSFVAHEARRDVNIAGGILERAAKGRPIARRLTGQLHVNAGKVTGAGVRRRFERDAAELGRDGACERREVLTRAQRADGPRAPERHALAVEDAVHGGADVDVEIVANAT